MKHNYTILYGDEDERLHLVDDFKSRKDCKVFKYGFVDKNIFTHVLRKIHCSYRLNKIIPLPFKYLWYSFCKLDFNPEKDIVIIYMQAFHKYDLKTILKFLKRKKIKYYLVFLDSMDANTPTVRLQKEALEYISPKNILSFDRGDCSRFGFSYLDEAYYHVLTLKPAKIEYDLYFIGRLKPGRAELLNRLYALFKEHGVKARFDIYYPKFDQKIFGEQELIPEIKTFYKQKAYLEGLKEANKANCILEIGQEGQNAPSLRYFEAVTLGKKLLTNVEFTKNLNFYNKNYMKITDFSKKKIDFSWIKKRDKINYKYKGEFSPLKILDMIEQLEKKS